MEYVQLDTETRRKMLLARIERLEQEHFEHEMNVKSLEAQDPADETVPQAIRESRTAQEIIGRAHAAVLAELAALPEQPALAPPA